MKIKLFIYLLISSVSGVFAQNINVALGKPTTADSVHSDAYPSSKAVDGNKLELVDRWVSVSSIWPHWIEVDLEGSYEIEQLKFWTGYNGYNSPVQYEFQIWDGSSWLTVVDGGSNSSPIVDESFTKVTTSRVRLYANSGQGNYFRLYEIEVYGTEVGGNDGGGNTTTPTNTENSVWEAVNSDINYTAGKVGIGMVPAVDGDYVLGVTGNTNIIGGLDVRTSEESDIYLSSGIDISLNSDNTMNLTSNEVLTIASESSVDISSLGLVKIAAAEGGTLNLYSGSNASLSAESKLNVYGDEIDIHGESGFEATTDQFMSFSSNDTMSFTVREEGDITMNTSEGGDILLTASTDSVKLSADNIDIRSESDTAIRGDGNISLSTDENISIAADSGISFGTSSEENININTNSVRIGATTAQGAEYKLAVGGKVIAEEMKIALQADWPDYVFENNYQLPTLKEVEKHINKKGHLANIPSAKEVKKEGGIHLGEMNVKLLQKIEELTLYTIAQEKAIKAQTEKNAALEARLAKLEALLIK